MDHTQEHFSSLATHRLPIAVLDPHYQVVCVSRPFARLWTPSSTSPPHTIHPLLDFPISLLHHHAVDQEMLARVMRDLKAGKAHVDYSSLVRAGSPVASISSSISSASSSSSSCSSTIVPTNGPMSPPHNPRPSPLTATQPQPQPQPQPQLQSAAQTPSAKKQKAKAKAKTSEEQPPASPLTSPQSSTLQSSFTSEARLIPIKANRFWLANTSGQKTEFILMTFHTTHLEQPSPPTANEEMGSRIRLGLSVLSTIIKDTADAMITITATGTIVSFNPAAARIFGYPASEIVGQNVKILMPEPHKDLHDTYIRNYQTTGEAKIIGIGREVTAVTREGALIPIHLSVSEIRLQDTLFYAGILRDLREAKKAESSLAREHALLASVMNAANDAIVTIDSKGIMVSANRATCKIFGYTQAELIGQNVKMLMSAPYRQQHDGYLKEYLKTGKAKVIGIGREVTCMKKDLSEFPADLSVSQVKVHESVYFTGILRDLTERKKADSDIAKGDAIIREVLMKSELLSKISNMFGEKEGVAAAAEELKMRINQATEDIEQKMNVINRRLDDHERRVNAQRRNVEVLGDAVRQWVAFKQQTYKRLVGILDHAFDEMKLADVEAQGPPQ